MLDPIAAALGATPGESLLDAARRVVGERDEARRWAARWKASAKGWKHVQLTWHIPLTTEFERARRWARAWRQAASVYRSSARFASEVYRRRESRIRELRARVAELEKGQGQ